MIVVVSLVVIHQVVMTAVMRMNTKRVTVPKKRNMLNQMSHPTKHNRRPQKSLPQKTSPLLNLVIATIHNFTIVYLYVIYHSQPPKKNYMKPSHKSHRLHRSISPLMIPNVTRDMHSLTLKVIKMPNWQWIPWTGKTFRVD